MNICSLFGFSRFFKKEKPNKEVYPSERDLALKKLIEKYVAPGSKPIRLFSPKEEKDLMCFIKRHRKMAEKAQRSGKGIVVGCNPTWWEWDKLLMNDNERAGERQSVTK